MQLRLSAPHQFDTMRLVATLGDCDDEVAWALVSYAIAVLEGGNPTAQGWVAVGCLPPSPHSIDLSAR